MRLRLFLLSALAALTFLITPQVWGQAYTVTDLGTGLYAKTINFSGQIAYTRQPSGASRHYAYRYDSVTGVESLLQDLGDQTFITGMDRAGTVVGFSKPNPYTSYQAVTLTPSSVTNILTGTSWLDGGAASAISGNGLFIVGRLYKANGDPSYPFLWNNGTKTNLSLAGMDIGINATSGINNTGQIVGRSNGKAILYTGGVQYDLTTNVGSLNVDAANAINAQGQVVGLKAQTGFIQRPNGSWIIDYQAFVWTPDEPNAITGKLTECGTLGGYTSELVAINAWGVAVGRSETSITTGTVRACIWRKGSSGSLEDLNNLIDPSLGIVLDTSVAINDKGWILVYGTVGGGANRLYILKPNP